MARKRDFNGQAKPIAATTVQTVTWSGNEISQKRIVAYHFGFTAAGNTLADVTRIKIFSNGFPIVNMDATQLRAYLDRFTRANFNLATTAQRFTVPFYLPDAPSFEMGDISQFPNNAQVQIELSLGAGTAAGAAFCGWTETNIAAELHPKLLSSVLNIPASAANARYNFAENGIVRAISCPTVGVDRVRLVVDGESCVHAPGALFLAVATGDISVEGEALAGGGVNVADPIFHEISIGRAAPSQSSYIELSTGATWAGVANESCIYAVAPNQVAI